MLLRWATRASSGWSATSIRTSNRPGTSSSRRRPAPRVFGSNNLFSYFSPFKIQQQSLFGELTYNFTEPFAVTVGARHYHYMRPSASISTARSRRRS